MAQTLVIVESPAKAKTIEKYLGRNYTVRASLGHVRDLPKSKMGIDIDNNFTPEYITIRGKGPTIAALKKEMAKADKVILATDPDREGEAIAWHLTHALKLEPEKTSRVVFQEITKDAVRKAMKAPRAIDEDLVDSQQARRILDRLVGYSISPILWRKVMKGLSAGRVQSVAMRLIMLREREIRAFVSEEYWTFALKMKNEQGKSFSADVIQVGGKKLYIDNETDARELERRLKGLEFSVANIEQKERVRAPYPPFTTSTLQQEASFKLNFSASKTMMTAQRLYEGIRLQRGSEGLITYMRTDSTRISDEALAQAKEYITEEFGEKYSHRRAGGAGKNAQDAHEAIRPTSPARTPESIKAYLSRDEYRLYELIWNRFMASQMSSARFFSTTVEIEGEDVLARAKGEVRIFDGFQKVYEMRTDAVELPEMKTGEKPALQKIDTQQKFTQPPSRYTEASLIKEMEEKGIGRPSTYAPTLYTITKRGYVTKEKKSLVPTELGEITNNIMEENFLQFVEPEFTAQMEERLDAISDEKLPWQDVIREYYSVLKPLVKQADERIKKYDLSEVTDLNCEKCGSPMLIKKTIKGSFYACSNYPECRNTKPILKEIGVKCPLCADGEVVERKTKKLKIFYGCSNFPECRFAVWDKPVGRNCPECGSALVEGKGRNSGQIVCSNRECSYKEKKK